MTVSDGTPGATEMALDWYLRGMETTIDAAGRLVIPKAIRDALGLVPGQRLRIETRDGRVEIEPEPVEMRLVRRGKGLVAEAADEMPVLTAEMVRATLERTRR